jgi:hypothetical protein
MAQLVGMSCTHCGGRISSELDAAFCPTCGQPCHTACKRTPGPEVADRCTACGAPFDALTRARREAERVEAKRAATPRPLNLLGAARGARRLYKLGRFLLVGVLLILLGVLMVAEPDLRDDSRRVSTGDIARGGTLGVAGVAVGLIGWWFDRNARRSGKGNRAEPNAAPDRRGK